VETKPREPAFSMAAFVPSQKLYLWLSGAENFRGKIARNFFWVTHSQALPLRGKRRVCHSPVFVFHCKSRLFRDIQNIN
jgi:hypothetical protein